MSPEKILCGLSVYKCISTALESFVHFEQAPCSHTSHPQKQLEAVYPTDWKESRGMWLTWFISAWVLDSWTDDRSLIICRFMQRAEVSEIIGFPQFCFQFYWFCVMHFKALFLDAQMFKIGFFLVHFRF